MPHKAIVHIELIVLLVDLVCSSLTRSALFHLVHLTYDAVAYVKVVVWLGRVILGSCSGSSSIRVMILMLLSGVGESLVVIIVM